ncbi:MAG: hypothetical protein GY766_27300, partial [Herbaspirillum sp.]|nr:hypothetical protein [Herbaspirillum sp.]
FGDSTDGSETQTVVISGVPSEVTLSAGTDNGDGTWTVSTGDLGSLSATPDADYNGTFDLTITATAVEGENQDTETASETFTVTISAVGDAPAIVANAVTTDEDTGVALNISATVPGSTETVDSVTISGLPDGATLSAGTDNGDGSYTLTPAQLTGLTLTPADDSDADFDLSISATSTDGTTTTATQSVDVAAVADDVTATGGDVSGTEDGGAIDLDVSATFGDSTDGSETQTVVISGVPSEVTLSAGTDNGDGTWTVSTGDLGSLSA